MLFRSRRAVDLTLRVPARARLVADVTLDEFANDLAERLVVFVVDVAVHVDSLCFEWMLWAPVDRQEGASEARRAGDCSRTSLSVTESHTSWYLMTRRRMPPTSAPRSCPATSRNHIISPS